MVAKGNPSAVASFWKSSPGSLPMRSAKHCSCQSTEAARSADESRRRSNADARDSKSAKDRKSDRKNLFFIFLDIIILVYISTFLILTTTRSLRFLPDGKFRRESWIGRFRFPFLITYYTAESLFFGSTNLLYSGDNGSAWRPLPENYDIISNEPVWKMHLRTVRTVEVCPYRSWMINLSVVVAYQSCRDECPRIAAYRSRDTIPQAQAGCCFEQNQIAFYETALLRPRIRLGQQVRQCR